MRLAQYFNQNKDEDAIVCEKIWKSEVWYRWNDD